MIEIIVEEKELWDEIKEEFVVIPRTKLTMEHSLISISKWEQKYKKPFLDDKPKTYEEFLDYMKCMTISPSNVDPLIYKLVQQEDVKKLSDYIQDSMTATWFSDRYDKHLGIQRGKKTIITSEVIYYWMVALQIPFECQKWHLNRLITLVRVCNEKNKPAKKMSRKEIIERNKEINRINREKMNTKG